MDLRVVLPRLEWLSVEQKNTSGRSRFHIRAEIYTPLTMETLHSRCRLPWTDRSYYGLCVLGTYLASPIDDPMKRTDPDDLDPDDLDVHEIISLVIHRDGGILASNVSNVGSKNLEEAFYMESSSDFSLVVHDHVSKSLARSTIQTLLDLGRLIPRSAVNERRREDEPFHMVMRMRCTSSFLSCFTEIVSFL